MLIPVLEQTIPAVLPNPMVAMMKTSSNVVSSRPRLQQFSRTAVLPLILFFVLLGIGAREPASAVTNIVWSDEFNGSSSNVDLTKWTFDIGNNGGWGNAEREFYTSRTNNAYVAGGVLHIVGRAELNQLQRYHLPLYLGPHEDATIPPRRIFSVKLVA